MQKQKLDFKMAQTEFELKKLKKKKNLIILVITTIS